VEELAKRGARVIGLSDPRHILDLSPQTKDNTEKEKSLLEMLLDGVRTRSKNKEVFLEAVDMSSPRSIREFCGKMIKSEKRVDGLVFCHEYRSVGSFFSRNSKKRVSSEEDNIRQTRSLATFYMTTLFLPSLLAAPAERDIRIVNVVNPFYAAALSKVSFLHFSESLGSSKQRRTSIIKAGSMIKEGIRSLRMIVFMKHLQTVLDALPSAPVPGVDERLSPPVPASVPEARRHPTSNISVTTINPGISLSDTVQPLLEPTTLGLILYIILYPLLLLVAKSSYSAMQTVLHVLFVPTQAKLRASELSDPQHKVTEDDVKCLVPGGLYANCGVVRVDLPVSISSSETGKSRDGKEADQGESPADVLGRGVWETMEREVKEWNLSEENTHS